MTIVVNEGLQVQGNYFGTNINYDPFLGNMTWGARIQIGSGFSFLIGGNKARGYGNAFCSNDQGLILTSNSAGPMPIDQPFVNGNLFGTDLTGMATNLGNIQEGMVAEPGAGCIIGGIGELQNTFAHNAVGIRTLTGGNWITQNSFYCNSDKGIDHAGVGNNLKMAPNITEAQTSQIAGTSELFDRVEVYLFDDTGCQGVAPCQGKTLLGIAPTDLMGNWVLTGPFPVALADGDLITAFAYDTDGNTSEFTSCKLICQPFDIMPSSTGPFCLGDSFGLSVTAPMSGSVEEYLWTGPANFRSTEQNPTGAKNAGTYYVQVTIDGCASKIDSVEVELNPSTSATLDMELCGGESIFVNGVEYNRTNAFGTEILEGQNQYGCDSIVNIALTFKEGGLNQYIDSICRGDFIIVNGERYDETRLKGADTIPMGSVTGCDSIIRVDINLKNENTEYIRGPICDDGFIMVNGERFDAQQSKRTTEVIGSGFQWLRQHHRNQFRDL